MDHGNLKPIKSTGGKEESMTGLLALTLPDSNQDAEHPAQLQAEQLQSDTSDEYGLEKKLQDVIKNLQ